MDANPATSHLFIVNPLRGKNPPFPLLDPSSHQRENRAASAMRIA